MRRGASLFTPRDIFLTSPFELMRRVTEDMDRFFEGTSRDWSTSTLWAPPIEVSEKDGQITICVELPGLNKDDVKVELTQEGLTIRGERHREEENRREGVYRSERSYGAFRRTIPMPDDVNVEQAKARFENGLLTVSVPVSETPQQRRREIPIESTTTQSSRKEMSATETSAPKAA